jgi:chemotaxis protein methyltransferase CheR
VIVIRDKDFWELVEYMKKNFGINLSQKKTLIEGRLRNYIMDKGFEDFEGYIKFALADITGKEIGVLINKLTTNHTFFLRESKHYEFLAQTILPVIEKNSLDKDLRIWSAGCSSGEEAYTIAMVLDKYFKSKKHLWDLKILATDISAKVLETGVRGIYHKESLENLPNLWKLNYFTRIDENTYQIGEKIKEEVVFRIFNLMEKNFPFKKRFHVIFCRNVMIYFDQETKRQLFKKFYDSLELGGYLFIGHSESMGKENIGFNYIMPAIYQKG